MKTSLSLAFVMLFSATPAFVGCKATSGHEKAESTAMHMEELASAVDSAKTKVKAAAHSLASVINKGDRDPAEAFEQYKKDVADVETMTERGKAHFASLQAEGQTYMAAWEKQAATIGDPELKKIAEERRAKLSSAVHDVAQAMDAALAETTPYVKQLKDMQTYLSNDLTPAGISSVKGKSKEISSAAESICDKLDKVAEALTRGAPQFRTAKPPPEK